MNESRARYIKILGYISPAVIICAGILFRAFLIAGDNFCFDSDSSVIVLNAKFIFKKTSFPLFFPGQLYFSAVPSYILAVLFNVFGTGFLSVKIYVFLFSILLYLAVFLFVLRIKGWKTAVYAALFMSVLPTGFNGLHMSGSCGYELINLYGVLFLWIIYSFFNYHDKYQNWFLFIGILAGIGWFLHPMFIYFIVLFWIINAFYSFYIEKTEFVIFLEKAVLWIISFFAGSAFYWLAFLKRESRFAGFNPLSGFVADSGTMFKGLIKIFFLQIPELLNIKDMDNFPVKLLLIFIYIVFISLIFYSLKSLKSWKSGKFSLESILAVLFVVMVMIHSLEKDSDTTARHLISMIILYPVFMALLVEKIPSRFSRMKYFFIPAILIFNLSTYSHTSKVERNDHLINYLKEKNLKCGFANYWLCYNLIYFSDESIILYPFWGNSRFNCYTFDVMSANNKFYLFNLTDSEQKLMLDRFIDEAKDANLAYEIEFVDEFALIHSLTIFREGRINNVIYFSPVYEELAIRIDEFLNKQTKDLALELYLPKGEYTFVTALETQYLRNYFPDAPIASFSITDSFTSRVIGKITPRNNRFKNNKKHEFIFRAYITESGKETFRYKFQEKSIKAKYICIF